MTLMKGLRKPRPCSYCKDESGKPQGYTMILGKRVTCPMCQGYKIA